jgi:DNA mismatch repair ATPase MutS
MTGQVFIAMQFVSRFPREKYTKVYSFICFLFNFNSKNFRQWFELPTRSKETLTQRLDGISFFFHDCNLDATSYIRNLMKDITAVKANLSSAFSFNFYRF